jgi:hypothetical protein
MKCDTCKFMEFHDGGILKLDDLSFHYCSKDHWEFDLDESTQNIEYEVEYDPWVDCKDYQEKITL